MSGFKSLAQNDCNGHGTFRVHGIRFSAFAAAALGVILLLALTVPPAEAGPPSSIDVSNFPARLVSATLPAHWQLQTFPAIASATEYSIVADDLYGPVIRARAAGSAAGLVRRITLDPRDYPILTWVWKVSKTLPGSSLTSRQGDDFPARLLVSFSTDFFSATSGRTLCYVWATSEPVETMKESPYHQGVVTIVASSGGSAVGSWQQVRRNIVADYLRVYGEMPGVLRAVSLLSDTDDTADSVTAWYGPISLGSEP